MYIPCNIHEHIRVIVRRFGMFCRMSARRLGVFVAKLFVGCGCIRRGSVRRLGSFAVPNRPSAGFVYRTISFPLFIVINFLVRQLLV